MDFSKIKGIIGVCGASVLSKKNYDIVVELGAQIAKKGYAVVCGGLYGTMEAVCKGAKREDGFTIGILPSENKASANPFVDLIIPTGIGEARNFVLVNTADGIISVSGGSGTLIEIAYAWRMGKPIVALRSTGGWSESLSGKRIDDLRLDKIQDAERPFEAVQKLIDLMGIVR